MTNSNGPSSSDQDALELAYLHGFNAVIDNVKRRQAYERLHPAVQITHTEDPWEWTATWTDEVIRCEVRDEELGGLLDKLDNLNLP